MATAFLGLTLRPDNRRVLLTNFLLIGRWHEDKTQVMSLKASKFWTKITDSLELYIPFNGLSVFTFDGGSKSVLVASKALAHKFVKLGGVGFTVRAFGQMTTSSLCRVTFAC